MATILIELIWKEEKFWLHGFRKFQFVRWWRSRRTAQLMVAETSGNQVTERRARRAKGRGHREEGRKSQGQRRPSKSTSVTLSDALRSVIIIFYELALLNGIFLCRLLDLGTRQLWECGQRGQVPSLLLLGAPSWLPEELRRRTDQQGHMQWGLGTWNVSLCGLWVDLKGVWFERWLSG